MIYVNNISKIFNSDLRKKPHVALNNLSFNVKEGSITGFLGPNGAGKTTLIKIIFDFIRASSGCINFSEKLGKTHSEIFSNIGYLPERPYYYPHLTGYEFIHYLGLLSNLSKIEIKNRVNHWSVILKIQYALDKQIRFYSKGMLQRLGFLSAVIHRPKFIILDEPASGLDPVGRKEIKDAICSINKEGVTIFFSTHIVSDVEDVCNQLVFISEGELQFNGSLKDLLIAHAVDDFEIKYFDDKDLKIIHCKKDELDFQINKIKSSGFKIYSIQPNTLTLEEIIYKTHISKN